MKSLKILMLATVIMFSVSVNAQTKIDTIKVSGECGMCKSRIQKTLKIDGIASAAWDTETKLLVVAYDVSKISNDDIQKKIADGQRHQSSNVTNLQTGLLSLAE